MYTLCTSRDIYHRNGSHQVRDEFLCWSAPCPFWKNRPGITFCTKSFSVTCTALNTWPLGIHYLEICPVISPWGWDFPGSMMGAGVWWHSNWQVSRSEAAVLPFWICWVCAWWVTSNNELWELCRGWECWLFLVCNLPCPPQLPSHPRTGVCAGATEPDQPLAHRLHLKNTTTHSIGFADNRLENFLWFFLPGKDLAWTRGLQRIRKGCAGLAVLWNGDWLKGSLPRVTPWTEAEILLGILRV